MSEGTMGIKLSSDEWSSDKLCCPDCGSYYMHQHRVEVFSRGEDEKTIGLAVDQYTSEVSPAEGDNPSSRRQGLVIYFRCEDCNYAEQDDVIKALRIYQHKGITFMEWGDDAATDKG